MLFKRRDKLTLAGQVRNWAWPRRSWRRSYNYVWHRVTRLSGTPHGIALGFAAGIFASFTPFMGFHFILAAAIAFIVGGNLLASAFGTFVGNPLTFPFIWLATYNFGSKLLGHELKSDIDLTLPHGFWLRMFHHPSLAWDQFADVVGPYILPMIAGGLPLGILISLLAYFPIRSGVQTYQHRRREKMHAAARRGPGDASYRS